MDLEQIWKQGSSSDEQLNRLLRSDHLEKLPSKLPLKKLKANLLIGIAWGILITAGYAVLCFYMTIWPVRLTLAIVSFFNGWIIIESWKLYKATPDGIRPSNSIRQELERNYQSFQAWWRIQEKVSLFVYPIAITGGFILGGYLGSGKPVEAFLSSPAILIPLIVSLIVLVPACYYLARWMFNYTYGKHLMKLKELLDELDKGNN